MQRETWSELLARWRGELGLFDELAIYERTQAFRGGVALLLLRSGKPLAFIRLRYDGATALGDEHEVMSRVWRWRPSLFSVPEPLGHGSVGAWHYLAMKSLPSPEHRVPRNPPLTAITAEIGAALQHLPRPSGTPDHWLPMHGDFTPWNLRELSDGALILYDWEDATWGPPSADEVLYRATVAALGSAAAGPHEAAEAVRFWDARARDRSVDNDRDRKFQQSLRRALRSMQPHLDGSSNDLDASSKPNPPAGART